MPIHCCAMQGRMDAIQALLFFDTEGSIKRNLEMENEVFNLRKRNFFTSNWTSREIPFLVLFLVFQKAVNVSHLYEHWFSELRPRNSTPEKLKNAALFLLLGIPSKLILHENGALETALQIVGICYIRYINIQCGSEAYVRFSSNSNPECRARHCDQYSRICDLTLLICD